MKASELITKVQKFVDEYGDMTIVYFTDGMMGDVDIGGVKRIFNGEEYQIELVTWEPDDDEEVI